jgi:hypothetical protein
VATLFVGDGNHIRRVKFNHHHSGTPTLGIGEGTDMKARRASLSVIVTNTGAVTTNTLANLVENMTTGVSLSANHNRSGIAHDRVVIVPDTLVSDNRAVFGKRHLPMLEELIQLVNRTIGRVGMLPLEETKKAKVGNVVPDVFKQTVNIQTTKRSVLEEHITVLNEDVAVRKHFDQVFNRHQIDKGTGVSTAESSQNGIPPRIGSGSRVGLNLTIILPYHNGQRIIGLTSAENIHICVIEYCVSFCSVSVYILLYR